MMVVEEEEEGTVEGGVWSASSIAKGREGVLVRVFFLLWRGKEKIQGHFKTTLICTIYCT